MFLSVTATAIAPRRIELLAAASVLLLGIAVMLGWWLQSELIVRVISGHAAMRFNTALSFSLLGAALLLERRFRLPLIGLVAVVSVATMMEYALDRDLGIDELFAFRWRSDLGPARMAPQTALCFLLAASALLLRDADCKWCRVLTRLAAGSVAVVGTVGLIGYLVGFEILYSLYDYTPMAIHTAAGMVLVGIAIIASLQRMHRLRPSQFAQQGFRVNLVATIVVVGIAFASGTAGFVVVGQELQESTRDSMVQILRGDQQLLELELSRRRDDLQRIATRPILHAGLRALNGQVRDEGAVERLKAMVTTLQARPVEKPNADPLTAPHASELVAIEAIALDGRSIRSGAFTADPSVTMYIDESMVLLWKKAATLYVQTEVFDGAELLGRLKLEYRYDILDNLISHTDAIGETVDLRVCSATDDRFMQCLPTRLSAAVGINAPRFNGDQPLAMHYALQGRAGSIEYMNFRNVKALASYTAFGKNKIGLVLMRDVADLYAPLRTRLYMLIAMIAVIAALGIGVLRLRVAPLVQGLETARQDADTHSAQLRSVMQTVPDGIFTIDAHGTILSVNPAIVIMFGYAEAELLNASCAILLPELAAGDLSVYAAWSHSFREMTAGAANAGPEFDPGATSEHSVDQTVDELVARHKNGHTFTVQLGLAELLLDGKVAYVGVVSDITERVRSRAKLNESFDLLQSTVNGVAVGIAVFGSNNKLRIWNSRFVELCGISANRLSPGAKAEDIIRQGAAFTPMEDHPSGFSLGNLASASKLRRVLEADFRRNDGRIMTIALRPTTDLGFVLTYSDVTALAEAEFRYRDQATRLHTTLDSIVDAIVTINESGSIESWSKGAERTLGYRSDEVLGRNVNMLMPQPHAAAHDGYVRRYMQTRTPRVIGRRRAMEARHKDGHHVPVNLSVSEMVIGGSRLFVGVLTDISAQLEMDRMKTGFVAAVSHELRTPLTSIAGSLGLLAGGVSGDIPEKAQRMIAIAKNNCDRLVRLINDILDIEKADSGKMDFKLAVQPLMPILERVVEAMHAYAVSCGVRIELQAAAIALTVMVDTDRLIQVLTNLLSNAAKFSPRDAVVNVGVVVNEDSIRINVRDHGAGIPKEFQGRIFEKFAQADNSDARAAGTGLGLAISKSIVERMSGSIGFETRAGSGTTFYVDLPNYAPIDDQLLAQSSVLRNVAVLICEDEREAGHMLETTLLREGAHPVVVRCTKDARRELAACKYDLLVTDINLPDGNGIDVIRDLRTRANTHALPVIVVSASSRAQHAPELLESLNIADWIRKPIVPARVLRAARQLLTQKPQAATSLLLIGDDPILSGLLRTVLPVDIVVESMRSVSDAITRMRVGNCRLAILIGAVDAQAERELAGYVGTHGLSAVPLIAYGARTASPTLESLVKGVVPHPTISPEAIPQLLALISRYVGSVVATQPATKPVNDVAVPKAG